MSSWKNIAKGSREHRERHQPESRKHLGLLEKKKDYKLRAKNYSLKRNKLKKLQKKALNRNPDEFAFHMINSEIKDGFHFEKEKPEEHTEAQLKLMQTQDSNYINYKLSSELKKIEKLKSELQLLDADNKPKNTHTFYVHKSEAKKFDVAKKLNTHPSLLDRTYNRPTLEKLKVLQIKGDCDEESIEKTSLHIQQQYNELSKRIERAEAFSIISQKLDVKKKLLNKKDPPAKIVKEGSKTNAAVYVWKRERKR